jgi:hypothetical protein
MVKKEPTFIEWFNAVLRQWFVHILLGLTTFIAWQAWDISRSVSNHTYRIEALETEVKSLKASVVTRSELLETMKRVEQQLEIMMLRAGVKPSSRMLSGG